ncbi:MAG: hydrogenase expression/formation protein HypE [Campylobacterales bacterium]
MNEFLTLSHGSGGEESSELISGLIYSYFKNDILLKSEDAAVFDSRGKLAFTTDSYTVSPLFFSGGDIGKLAICGTCNDLAMMGARPMYLSCSFLIEEGFSIDEFKKILQSMKSELEINGAKIVCGDTKIVPKGSLDKIYINTTGVGEVLYDGISQSSLALGDVIIASGYIGDHGATIFASREGIGISGELKSDCASLYASIKKLIDAGVKIKALRDATRGGIAAVLNEWAKASSVCIEVDEASLMIKDSTKGLCEILGFEAYNLANEGMFLLCVDHEEGSRALEVLKKDELCKNASLIGEVIESDKVRVELKSSYGTKRLLDYPSGELLPRIC